MQRRMRERNLIVSDAHVGAVEDPNAQKGSGLVTAMLATMGVILFLGLFAAGDAASGRSDS